MTFTFYISTFLNVPFNKFFIFSIFHLNIIYLFIIYFLFNNYMWGQRICDSGLLYIRAQGLS